MFVEFEERGGVVELALFEGAAIGLDFAEGGERFLELAREAGRLDVEIGEGAVGVKDGEAVGAGDEPGFEERDAVETPGGVGQFGDELGFGGSGGLVFVEEGAAVGFDRRRGLRWGGPETRR